MAAPLTLKQDNENAADTFSLAFLYRVSKAEEITFYQKETDKFWSVFGGADVETGHATCYSRANKKDGSFIRIHRSPG